MLVSSICTEHVVTVEADLDVIAAAKLMRDHHVGDVVIVEERPTGKLPVGIVTDRDIVIGALAQGVDDLENIRIGDLRSNKFFVVSAQSDVMEAFGVMLSKGVRRMPVVTSQGTLAGILTYDDVVAWMVSKLSALTRSFANQGRREEFRRP